VPQRANWPWVFDKGSLKTLVRVAVGDNVVNSVGSPFARWGALQQVFCLSEWGIPFFFFFFKNFFGDLL
jgi:hypothetical protein